MTTHVQKIRSWFSKMKKMIRWVATTHFVMQNNFHSWERKSRIFEVYMLDQGDKPLIWRDFVLMKKIMSKNQGNCLDVHLVDLFKFFCASFFFSFDASMCNRSNNVIHNMWKNDILGSYLIKYSRLHFIFFKAMNRTIPTNFYFSSLSRWIWKVLTYFWLVGNWYFSTSIRWKSLLLSTLWTSL